MAVIELIKINDCLVPSLDKDKNYINKLAQGEVIKADIKKPRNIKFHRKFFSLIQVVFDNQDKYEILEDLLIEIKLKTGHYKEHITTKGQIIYVPKSISFAKMDELSFNLFYDKAIDICLKYFCIGSTEEEINRMTGEILNYS